MAVEVMEKISVKSALLFSSRITKMPIMVSCACESTEKSTASSAAVGIPNRIGFRHLAYCTGMDSR
jgi:hypothetical protein